MLLEINQILENSDNRVVQFHLYIYIFFFFSESEIEDYSLFLVFF